jgi:endonuclease I
MCNTATRYVFLSVFFLLSFINVFPQDTVYYSTLSVTSPTFPANLETRVRSPFTSRTYSEFRDIMIPNYESVPTGVGTQRRVTCAYSGYTMDYTPPFAFGTLWSREHTYCQSWWDVSSTSNPYYSDFHHLFLTEQPHANGMRGNYPLGNCATTTTVFLDCKLGKNTLGQTVFEPRAIDKGDAARAMFYMVVMYDHNGSYGNWAFKWLNETKIPSTPQDLQTLLTWAKQDPPDKWEVERNNYIATLQQNRNPFVDHPEYLKYINLYDMSKLNPVFSPEPMYQVSNFSAVANGNSITVNWTNPSGGQLPSGYLLQAYNADNYFIPSDGDVYTANTDLSTGKAIVYIPNTATQFYTFSNLTVNTNYYFTIYSYNGTDTLINYKIDGKKRTNATTTATTTSVLTLKAFMQGFYNGSTMVSDTVTVELHNASSPYGRVETQKGVLNTIGAGNFGFSTAVNGTPYYLVIKHRNGLETWSAAGNTFSASALSYDFTTAQAQAFGSNQVPVGSKWCIYSGDVNHDGTIDLFDVSAVDNDNSNFAGGYVDTDVNGDGTVDLFDVSIVDNNNSAFVSKIIPTGAPSAIGVQRSVKIINGSK